MRWLTGLAEGYSQRRAAKLMKGQLDTCKTRRGTSAGARRSRAGRLFAPEGKHLVRDHHSVRGRGRPGPGASEPFRTRSDRRPAGRTRSGVETRTLPKQKASHSAVQKGSPATRGARHRGDWGSNHAPARRGRGST